MDSLGTFCINIYSTEYLRDLNSELPFRLKGTDKIHTEGLTKFHSNIYSIFFAFGAFCSKLQYSTLTEDIVAFNEVNCSTVH